MRYSYLLLYLTSSLFAADFFFAHPEHPWHVFAEYAQVGKADFEKEDTPCSQVRYSEGAIALYYSQFINQKNFLTLELGNNYINFDWKENPRFRETQYNTAVASIAFITMAKERWRWTFNPGATVDASTFNFGNSGVYYGLVWGRYAYSYTLGFHIGGFGYYGIRNAYVVPVIGFDWNFWPDWRLNLIFPLNFSLEYQISPSWVTLIALDGFGGPYRFPRRAHKGINGFENGIFQVFSSGVEWAVNYLFQRLKIEAGIGWNFGGWILIRDSHNRNGKYFNFDGAPYGQANLAFTF
jgi:hypothetical protein